MKNLTQLFCCIILILGFSTPTKAQGWEIFVSDPSLIHSSNLFRVFPSSNNGTRLAFYDLEAAIKMLHYDSNGDFIGNEEAPGTDYWELIQSDDSGATYWSTYSDIRKIDANNQVVWTFNMTVPLDVFFSSPGPNGSTYARYSDNNGNTVIDVINKDGILEHSFNLNEVTDYFPTGDLGMLYNNDLSGSLETIWTKLDNQGNLVWSKDLENLGSTFIGSTDGSTYLTNFNHEDRKSVV